MSVKLKRSEFMKRSVAAVIMAAAPGRLLGQELSGSSSKASGFGARATAEQVTAGQDLRGKTILVTGANSGLGFETMRVLALRGAHVLCGARTLARARAAAGLVPGKVTPVACELTDFQSVVRCAESVLKLKVPLDGLICNAGIMRDTLETAVGLEKQFVVNYLGHFLLARRLMSALEAAPQGRVVMVSSGLYVKAPAAGIDFDNLDGRKSFDGFTAYGQSKLAMILFAQEFSRRFPGSSVTANAVYPGVIETNLFRDMAWYKRLVIELFGWAFLFTKTVAQGAATQCFVATHGSLRSTTGALFADCKPVVGQGPHLGNRALAKRLWDVSLALTRDYLKTVKKP